MLEILILKTAALGDVLRTTSILPGIAARWLDANVTWVTAPGAADLVRWHPRVDRVLAFVEAEEEALRRELTGRRWDLVLSFDDELPLCRLASALDAGRTVGAVLDERGERAYTDDAGPWFDMGLLSRFGKEEADRRKVANRRSHPEIFAGMVGVDPGAPALGLTDDARAGAASFAREAALGADGRAVVGLNTGAGGRWLSKQLSVDRTVELARLLADSVSVSFVVFGGPDEAARNAELVARLRDAGCSTVDAGCDNPLLDFAARVERCDVLVTSDSLAMHVGIALGVRVVAFFAPTSAAEIELYDRGEKVVSTADDYCSYRTDADNTSITPERLAAAVERQLEALAREEAS